jgi:hypothetical protein
MSISFRNFLPTVIPGIAMWFDGSDTSTMSFSGSTVTQWRDKSGNGRHANQNTGATFSTNSLVFTGSQYYTVTNGTNLFRNVYFAIFVVETLSGVNPTSFIMGDTAGGVNSGSLHIGYRTNSNLTMAFWNADLEITGLSGTGIRRLWSFILPSTGNRFVNLNGTTVGTYSNNTFLNAMANLLIGSAFAFDFYRGSLFEIVGFNTNLPLAQIQQMEGYLAQKWGLQANLPATHPYRVSSSSTLMRMSNQLPVTQRNNFFGTGSVQTFTVPPNVFMIRFFIWGSGGIGQNGGNFGAAGTGAFVEGTYQVIPGSVLQIVVGRPGAGGIGNGGGTSGGTGAGGGGFSGIFSGSPAANNVIAIAGAGGGSGFNGNGLGGGGGYPSGLSGIGGGAQGGGGTQTSAGTSFGGAAGQLFGGNGAGGDNGGGGGGGGWFGGGGGTGQGAGGGGSSTYISSVMNPITSNGVRGGSTNLPGGSTSPFWISPLGAGGQNGLVVIGYTFGLPRLNLTGVPITASTNLVFSHPDGRTWKIDSTNVRLNTGTTARLSVYNDPSVYNNSQGAIALFNNNNSTQAVRHAGFTMYYNAFTSNNYDWGWKFFASGTGYIIYNYYGGGWYVGYDSGSDQVLIVTPGDSRRVTWNITPRLSPQFVYV